MHEITVGTGRRIREGDDIAVISIGPIGTVVEEAIADVELDKQVSVAHYDLRFLKPLDTKLLDEIGKKVAWVLLFWNIPIVKDMI